MLELMQKGQGSSVGIPFDLNLDAGRDPDDDVWTENPKL